MELHTLTAQVQKVMEKYELDFPEVKVDRDYFPFKVSEEWGECLQTYLMLTDRGRQKGKSKEEIRDMFRDEIADVLGFLLLFAKREGIDPEDALQKKWFKYTDPQPVSE